MGALLALLTGTVGRWLIGGVVTLAIVGVGWLGLRTYYYNQGYRAALAAVAAKDAAAVKAAGEIHDQIQKCFDEGGTWNVEQNWMGVATGCVKP